MRRFLAACALMAALAWPSAAAAPDAAAAAPMQPAPAAGAFADALADMLRQRLRAVAPLPAPYAGGLAVVFSRPDVELAGGAATVTRSRRGDWHIALHGDPAGLDAAAFLARLERTGFFLPELIRRRRIFRSVAIDVAPYRAGATASYTLWIDPTPPAGAALRLTSGESGAALAWTQISDADSLRRIEALVRP